MLIPSWSKCAGSDSKTGPGPKTSCVSHSDSATLTTNQPGAAGARPLSFRSSGASSGTGTVFTRSVAAPAEGVAGERPGGDRCSQRDGDARRHAADVAGRAALHGHDVGA